MTNHYATIARSTTIPICTGEDIYLAKNFRPLMEAGGVSVIHPDMLTVGGALEMKKLGDMCEDYGVAMAIHMAESPVGCMAAIHAAAAVQNVLAVEFHSVDVPWWQSIAKGLPTPLMKNGFIDVPNKPGLGIDDLDDEVLAQHIHEKYPGLWEPTTQWDNEWANDREWS
jgi:L-alanine-DL-glutamate epimerase-like enolase superfamily enzyme